MMTKSSTVVGRLALTAAAFAVAFAGAASAQSLRFWTTEEQPDRLAKQQAMAEQFEAATGTESVAVL